ncbi:MAG: DNA polymerase III subunit beta [Phycisphaerales bacterium]|nr:DNA polymerase III subunit beta [Phycisphaerales bacterium]
MKVICDRGALLDAVNLVSGVVAVRTPRPQLTCVKLTATKPGAGGAGELTLSATDAEISLKLTLAQVDVSEPGEALIPADKLRQIISAEENEPTLTLEADDQVCHIRGADAHFKVFGFPVADFPPIPDFAEVLAGSSAQPKAKTVFAHTAGGLDHLVARTLFATARENSRYAINGVLMRRDGKKLEMVATDGRRLALCRGTLSSAGDKDAKALTCIIPTKALSQLQKLIHDPEETVQIAITDNQVLFSLGGEKGGPGRAVLTSNLVEGTFPPYEDVIPKDQDKKVVFDRDVLSSAVRRAALLTNEESRGVAMTFTGAKKQLELTSRAPETGEAEINIDLNSYEGEDIKIGFNPLFITDALKVINDPEVILELKAPNKPGVVKSGNDFLYVVMPVNLQ